MNFFKDNRVTYYCEQLGDEGASKLADILSSGTARSLLGLDASCNSIGPSGAYAISRSIAANSVLRALDLSANAIEVRPSNTDIISIYPTFCALE